MSTTANTSTSRGERERELRARIEEHERTAAALAALARTIEAQSAPCAGWVPLWRSVAARLRDDSAKSLTGAQRAKERLYDLAEARAAAERWVPRRSEPC